MAGLFVELVPYFAGSEGEAKRKAKPFLGVPFQPHPSGLFIVGVLKMKQLSVGSTNEATMMATCFVPQPHGTWYFGE